MPLHPEFPIVEGRYQLTRDWSIFLPTPFNRRVQDGSLVIWKPGFTIWLGAYNNDRSESKEQRLEWIQADASPEAFDEIL